MNSENKKAYLKWIWLRKNWLVCKKLKSQMGQFNLNCLLMLKVVAHMMTVLMRVL